MTLVVIDSNVLGHAINPQDPFFECASELVEVLLGDESVVLVLDDGDLLRQEYDENVGGGASISRALLIKLELTPARVFAVDPSALTKEKRDFIHARISQRKPRDRTVVKLATVAGATLVSDDKADLHAKVRKDLRKRLGVAILDSCEGLDFLGAAS